jgi:hypothetical protein
MQRQVLQCTAVALYEGAFYVCIMQAVKAQSTIVAHAKAPAVFAGQLALLIQQRR